MNFTLSTAHPVKFSETVDMAVGKNLALLSNYKDLFSKDERIHSIQNNTDEVKKFILENKN
jgi:threonine synthase